MKATQQSFDGNNFKTIHKTVEKGLQSDSYVYADNISEVDSKVIYYRLQSVDKDGKFVYSKIISVKLKVNDGLIWPILIP